MTAEEKIPTREREARVMSGWPMLVVTIALYAATPVLMYYAFVNGQTSSSGGAVPDWWLFAGGCVVLAAAVLLSPGFFTIQPNEARVLILFGAYHGTCKQVGFRWGNPFYANGPAGGSSQTQRSWRKRDSDDGQGQAGPMKLKRYKVSLRARTLNGDKLKVNDKRGNPVDIAAVVVWRVEDTAKAVFDVDDFETYVATQSETAVRHLASAYPYDRRVRRHRGRDHAARQRRRGLRGAARGAHGAARAGGRDRGAGPPHPPRLRAGDRPGDAPPPAGRGRHRRAPQDRHGRGEHGRDGAPGLHRAGTVAIRRGAQGRHGQQPHGRALRREPGDPGREHRHAVQ